MEKFGPYIIEKPLGFGGMAQTVIATRMGVAGFSQRVCLKRMRHDLSQNPDFVRQFLDEARVSATLSHAHIAQVLDFGVQENVYYLALELVEGLDLSQVLKKLVAREQKMSWDIVALLAHDIGSALEHAHGSNRGTHANGSNMVLHRDISSSNILISRQGEIKITDFGIAKTIAKDQLNLTTTKNVQGKVPYMAPDYAFSGRYDVRCDLFSLGVVLYEALAGVRPFDGGTDLDTLRKSSEGEYLPLGGWAPDAPESLIQIITKLIQPSPENRFQNTTELLDALESVAPSVHARRILGQLVRALENPTAPPTPEATMALTPKRSYGHVSAPALPPGALNEKALAASTMPSQETRTLEHPLRSQLDLNATDAPKSKGKKSTFALFIGALSLTALSMGIHLWSTLRPKSAPPLPHVRSEPVHVITVTPPASPVDAPTFPAVNTPIALKEEHLPQPTTSRISVRVFAVPHGDVWVDGKHISNRATDVRLLPGMHTFESKNNKPVRRQVRITPSGPREVKLVIPR